MKNITMNDNCQHIVFSDEAYNAIMAETFKMSPNETGGILLGHILDNGIWIVMEVLPPGWRSIFQYTYFEYDEQFVNYVAENESKKYEQELILLGLWHRHPGSMDTFSGTDDTTNRIFAGLHQRGAISGLVNVDPRFRLTMYHVSNPLHYQKVEIAVGDDLIPEEYFKLKYYDEEKSLNPFPPEKKNVKWSTENKYEIGSSENNSQKKQTNSGIVPQKIKFWDSKNIFFLIFLVGLVLSLSISFPYNKVKDSEDIKYLHKIIYCINPTDSVLNIEKERAVAYFNSNKGKILTAEKKTEKEIAAQRKQYVNAERSAFIDEWQRKYYEQLNAQEANEDIKRIVITLWFLTILLLSMAVFLRYRHFLLPYFVRKRDAKFWFQKNQKLYFEEEIQIRNRFRKMEKTIENGTVSLFVPTDKTIDNQAENLTFQLVYADDYDKSKEIRIYLLTPDLNKLLGEDIKDFPYIEIDEAGEAYLDLSKTIDKDKVSGMEVIRKLYAWLQFYIRWQKQEISIKDIKLN